MWNQFINKLKTINRFWFLMPFLLVFLAAGSSDLLFRHAKNLDLFANAVKEITEYYVDPVSPTKLVRKGIDGMCKTLDPYTVIIAENDITDYRIKTTGKYGGIGVEFDRIGDSIVIMSVFENQAAEKVGIEAGDNIESINGISLFQKEADEVQKIITGSPGSKVSMVLRRPGSNTILTKEVIREEVKLKSVPYYGMLNENTGYIQLTTFSDQCSKEVLEALKNLKKENAKLSSLVFDLRNNGGGFLNEAINIVNIFVPKDVLIVTTKGKLAETSHLYKTLNEAYAESMPVVVLTNSQSASASEIVSGSLQDLEKGVIIGQKTYGKGLVQVTKPISYGNQLKVTIAKYYTPSGRCIQVLDYGHRNADGSVGKVPDSLKHPFKTKNGRTVYDGGGIEPDIKTNFEKESQISKVLEANNYYFLFAMHYHLMHPQLNPNAATFKLSDQDFTDFANFLKNKKYDYTSQTENQFSEFVKATEKENYKEKLKLEIDRLNNQLKSDKLNDLYKHKSELLKHLNFEVIGFYLKQKGQTENAFLFDQEVQEAIKLLNDSKNYEFVLAPRK